MIRVLATTFACLAAMAATFAAPAHAKGGKHFHGHRHVHLFVYSSPAYVVPSCGYAYAKWQHTGSFYWKKQYYICKGWW